MTTARTTSSRPRTSPRLRTIAAAVVILGATLAGAIAVVPPAPPAGVARGIAEAAIARDVHARIPQAPAFGVTCPELPATIAHCSITYADGIRVAASFDSRTGATGTGWWRD